MQVFSNSAFDFKQLLALFVTKMDLSIRLLAHLMILDIPGTLKNNQSHHDKIWNKVVLQQDGKGKKRFLKTKTKWRGTNGG